MNENANVIGHPGRIHTMPEMDGIALLRAARELDADLVGIMMTGHGTIDTAVEAMKSGALDYILKPFNLQAGARNSRSECAQIHPALRSPRD